MFLYGTLQGPQYLSPEITIDIRSPETNNLINDIEALLDTGSPITLIPERLIERLGIANMVYEKIRIRGATNQVEERRAYLIHLKVASWNFYDFRVGTFKKPYALIGRDIINRYNITLDGPQQRWMVNP
jgi:hypothetical protein